MNRSNISEYTRNGSWYFDFYSIQYQSMFATPLTNPNLPRFVLQRLIAVIFCPQNISISCSCLVITIDCRYLSQGANRALQNWDISIVGVKAFSTIMLNVWEIYMLS